MEENKDKKSFKEQVVDLNNTADTTNEFDQADIQNNKAMAILAYIYWLVLIPIFAAKDSKYARFHANQGLVLSIFTTAYYVVVSTIMTILTFVWTGFAIIGILFYLAGFAFVALFIIGIVNASKGKAKELPVIGKIRILK